MARAFGRDHRGVAPQPSTKPTPKSPRGQPESSRPKPTDPEPKLFSSPLRMVSPGSRGHQALLCGRLVGDQVPFPQASPGHADPATGCSQTQQATKAALGLLQTAHTTHPSRSVVLTDCAHSSRVMHHLKSKPNRSTCNLPPRRDLVNGLPVILQTWVRFYPCQEWQTR